MIVQTREKVAPAPQPDEEPQCQASFSGGAGQASMSWAEKRHFESIRQWIYDHTGLYYPERKCPLLYQRLKKLCWRLGIPGLRELDQHLQNRDFPGLDKELACAVSTNHSYFFREEKVIQFFKERILPTLPEEGKWRLWSAASASGEEAYTLAIILAEALGPEQAKERVAILGTDIDSVVIAQAEHGVYSELALEKVPQHLRRRYFHPIGSGKWYIDLILKQMCIFRRFNLMSAPWPFRNNFHVILCRNVLYYFDPEHQQELTERLYEVTVPGGWLITSVTEPVQTLKTRWQSVMSGVYRKT